MTKANLKTVVVMAFGLAWGALHATPVFAAEPGDAARGARLFLQCRACHAVNKDEASGVGPNLWGVVGQKAGSRPGYKYSAALAASGLVWTRQTLDPWMTQPTSVVPGTLMAFQGVPQAKAREDLIAYLYTLGPDTHP